MKNNLITIFNQLTCNSLADYNLFDNLLENHYEKIKYFYSLLDGLNLKKMKKIYCKPSKKSILVTIEPNDVDDINDIVFAINKNKNVYMFASHFNIDIIETGKNLEINISIVDTDEEEVCIYASRLI